MPKASTPSSATSKSATPKRAAAPAQASRAATPKKPAARDPRREARFPAIEKRYGEPMSHWFKVMAKLDGKKYPEQMAHLQENHGFSREHANALVMFVRGSTSSRRFQTPSDFFKSIDPQQAKTARAIFKTISAKYPTLELVIAWNQPMLRDGTKYIFGLSASKSHLLINPFSAAVIARFAPKMKGLRVSKRTVALPNDWRVDGALLLGLVAARMAEKR